MGGRGGKSEHRKNKGERERGKEGEREKATNPLELLVPCRCARNGLKKLGLPVLLAECLLHLRQLPLQFVDLLLALFPLLLVPAFQFVEAPLQLRPRLLGRVELVQLPLKGLLLLQDARHLRRLAGFALGSCLEPALL